MPGKMVVHDTRLAGNAPNWAPNTYKVNGSAHVGHIFGWVGQYARSQGGLDDLYVLCHGLSGGVHDTLQSISTSALGFGLQLGQENLTLSNVHHARALNGLVSTIWLYACGPANTRAGFRNTVADGTRFCQELAGFADAEVIAATQTQWYTHGGARDQIDFGSWEGAVYRFGPDASVSRVL